MLLMYSLESPRTYRGIGGNERAVGEFDKERKDFGELQPTVSYISVVVAHSIQYYTHTHTHTHI